jgi:hypothetical protein
MVPLVFVLVDVPALAVGASISTLWSTYTGEIGLYQELTLNAPNVYQYLGISESSVLREVGIALTLAIVLTLVAIAVLRRVQLTTTGRGAGSGAFSRNGGSVLHGPDGIGGLASHTVVSFKILSTMMLGALALALWTTIKEFRRPPRATPARLVHQPRSAHSSK